MLTEILPDSLWKVVKDSGVQNVPQRKNKPWREKLFLYDKWHTQNVLTILRITKSRLESLLCKRLLHWKSMPCGPALSTLKACSLFHFLNYAIWKTWFYDGLWFCLRTIRSCFELVHDFHFVHMPKTQSRISGNDVFWVLFQSMVTWTYTVQRQQMFMIMHFVLVRNF